MWHICVHIKRVSLYRNIYKIREREGGINIIYYDSIILVQTKLFTFRSKRDDEDELSQRIKQF